MGTLPAFSMHTDEELRGEIAAKMRTKKGRAEALDILVSLYRWYENDGDPHEVPVPLSPHALIFDDDCAVWRHLARLTD